MSKTKEELRHSDKALKESLEEQIANLKQNFSGVGKNALWIGGGLVGAYVLMKLLSGGKKNKKSKKITIKQAEPVIEKVKEKKVAKAKKENLLSDTVKEQLIIFLLGIATERLTKFLAELDKEEPKDDSK